MSWQDYVDNQLIASQCVSKACIAGHDGGVWAKSDGFEVSWWCNHEKIPFDIQKFRFLLHSKCRRDNGRQSRISFVSPPRPVTSRKVDLRDALDAPRSPAELQRRAIVICHHVFSPTLQPRLGVSDFPDKSARFMERGEWNGVQWIVP